MTQNPPPERALAQRRPRPVFVLYLALLVAGIGTAIAIGLIRGSDDAAAGEAVERFAVALEEQDGRAACNQLSADVRSELESQEAAECEQAILDAGL